MRVTMLGGGSEVGASAAHVKIGGHRILIDAGVRMKGADRLPDLAHIADLGGIEAVLVTHAHADHIGALPLVHQHYPNIPIYTTKPTLRLMEVMLKDALNIMGQNAMAEGEIPLYDKALVDAMFTRIIPVEPGAVLPILGGDVLTSWYPAGHILGACAIGLWGRNDASLFFSGDLSVTPQQTVGGLRLPGGSRFDGAVLESTYGNRAHANRQAEEARLVEAVGAVLRRGGRVLIPAFALGRAQEVMLLLDRAQYKGEMPAVPVHADGLVRAVSEAYSGLLAYLPPFLQNLARGTGSPFFRRNVRPVKDGAERTALLEGGEPAIFVASSGMVTGGASAAYAAALANDPGSAIFLSGYQDAESPGAALLGLADQGGGVLRLGDTTVQLRCQVAKYSLSAHADASELVGVARAAGAREVLLVHGDQGAREALGQMLTQIASPYLLLNGEEWTVEVAKTQVAVQGRRAGISAGRALTTLLLPELWAFTRQAEPGRTWTVEELAAVWYGQPSPAQVETMHEVVAEAGAAYWRRDPRRPFLMRPVAEEEWREAQERAAAEQRAASLVGHLIYLQEGAAVWPALVLGHRGAELEVQQARGASVVPVDRVLASAGAWPSPVDEAQAAAFPEAVSQALALSPDLAGWWEAARQAATVREIAQRSQPAQVPPTLWWLYSGWALAAMPEAFQMDDGVPTRFTATGAVPTTAPDLTPAEPLNQTEAHDLARRLFAEFGVYRAGLDVATKSITIYLALPDARPKEAQACAARLAMESGWRVKLHPHPHQEALVAEVHKVLPPGWRVAKAPAVHHGERRIVADIVLGVTAYPDQVRLVQRSFTANTGWVLEFKGIPGMGAAPPAKTTAKVAPVVPRAAAPVDQNTAITLAKTWAQEAGIPIYKVGLKQDHVGKLLELQFISPEVGVRYGEALQDLADQVGYRCVPAKTPHQQAITQAVRETLRPEWGLVGEVKLWIHEGRAQARLLGEPTEAEWVEACAEVMERTGYVLEYKIGG